MAEARPGAPVVLTGGTGFVGSTLQRSLRDRGYAVRVLVRPGSRNRDKVLAGCQAVSVALDDVAGLAAATRDAQAVVYGAGTVRGRELGDFLAANVAGVEASVAALAGHDRPPPLLLISSLAASRPGLSDYARSKQLGEQALTGHAAAWSILRPPAIYGPGDRELRPLLTWIRRGLLPAVGPVDQRLSFLHVEDLASAVLAWLRATDACHQRCFSLHDGRIGGYDWPAIGRAVAGRDLTPVPVPASLLKMAGAGNRLLSSLLGYAPMLTPGKVRELTQPDWVADNRAFTAATGWTPAIDLAEGAARLFSEPPRP